MADKSVRATCWSVTINNPTEQDELEVQVARATKGWKVFGQIEVGENGTPHYQLMVKSPQVRFVQMKKMFSRGHIEVARNPKQLEAYVQKEETRVGSLPQQSEQYPNQSAFWELVYHRCHYYNLIDMNTYNSPRLGWWMKEYDSILFESDVMVMFDIIVGDLIREGYYVEAHAMNPQVRGAWKHWSIDILTRTRDYVQARLHLSAPESVDTQDRQTTGAFDSEQTISVPVTNNEDASSQSGSPSSGSSSSSSDGTQDDPSRG